MQAWRKLVAALRNPATLGQRALGAGIWTAGGQALAQGIRLGSNLVMTRLLVPEAFGLMAVVFSLHAGLMMLSDVGIKANVIRSDRGDVPGFLHTAWTLQVLRGGGVAVLLVLAGAGLHLAQGTFDFGDTVYGAADLPGLIAASALVILCSGLESTTVPLAERRLAMAAVVRMEVLVQVMAVSGMIGLALVWPSVWALLAGAVIGAVLRLGWTHLLLPGPAMRFAWDAGHRAEIWRFGRWLIGSSFFGFLANQGDRIILGALLDVRSFGLYAIAMLWISAVTQVIGSLTRRVAFAAFGEVRRERPEEFRRVFARFQTQYGRLCLGLAAVFFLFGGVFIRFLYPPAYHASGDMLAVLAVSLFLYRYRTHAQFLLNTGDSFGYMVGIGIMAVGNCLIPLAAFLLAGTEAAVMAVALNAVWGLPWLFWRTRAEIRTPLVREAGLVLLAIDAALLRGLIPV